ncbi:hypothetical protein Tco_0933115, partial [Tanacetum coccineum]
LGPEEMIVDFLERKVGVYTKFFEFENFRIPISQFHFDILGHYQIHLSQLSVIGAAKQTTKEKHPTVLYKTPRLLEKLEQSIFLGGRENISHRSGLTHKRSEGWDADSELLFRGGRDSIGHTPYPYPKTTRSPVMPNRAEPEILSGGRHMDLFNLISAPNPTKVKTGTRPRAAHEALDFSNEDPPQTITERGGTEDLVQDKVAYEIPPTRNASTTRVALETGLEEEVAAMVPLVNKGRRKRASTGLDAGSILSTPAAQDPSTATKSVSDPELLSYAKPQPDPEQDMAQSSKEAATEIPTEKVATTEVNIQFSVRSPKSERSTSVPSVVWSPKGIYQPGWGVTNDCRLDTPYACQDMVDHIVPPRSKIAKRDHRIQVREEEIKKFDQEIQSLRAVELEVNSLQNRTKNLKTLLEAEVDMKKAAEAKNAELAKELDSLCVQFSDLQVSNNQLAEQVLNLQAQVTGEEKIKAAFEEFKKYEDDKVEQRCAEMGARLDKLSVDFDEELYPHMLTAIAGRRWVIGHGLRLSVMKCAESSEIRQAFADVVSARLAKGMTEGLKYGIEHGKAGRDLADIEAYDPEANSKLVKALQDLKDLKYPMMDQLERLKDAPMELIMASLHLESDTGEDAPQ